jgi:glycerol-3-phosphate cytidylyltransferase-like family protein
LVHADLPTVEPQVPEGHNEQTAFEVALTVDEEILKVKGYLPELEYSFRKEILESIRFVTEVVPSNWLIDESFLNLHRIDLLVHGDDNSNLIPKNKFSIENEY